MGQTVKTRILIRNDTADSWVQSNPVLLINTSVF